MRITLRLKAFFYLLCIPVLLLTTSRCDTPGEKTVVQPEIKTGWDDLLEGIKTKKDWVKKRTVLYQKFLKLIGDEAKPSTKPELALKIHFQDTVDHVYIRKLISYNVEPDQRAWAYLAIPLNVKGKVPAVVALHGTAVEGKDISAGFCDRSPDHTQQAHLDHLARRGFVVIAPDHFNMGRRLPPGGNYHTDILYRRHPDWSALGKIVYDASIAIDVLETLPEVDTEKIAAVGHSLGGQSTIYLAAYDQRIRVAASSDGSMTFRFNPNNHEWIRPEGQYSYFRNLRTIIEKGLLPPIDTHEIIALIAPRPYLDMIALNDQYGGSPATHQQRVMMDLRLADVWKLTGAPENFSFYVRGETHQFSYTSRKLMYAWLERSFQMPQAAPPSVMKKPQGFKIEKKP